jgi:hypothetical protein
MSHRWIYIGGSRPIRLEARSHRILSIIFQNVSCRCRFTWIFKLANTTKRSERSGAGKRVESIDRERQDEILQTLPLIAGWFSRGNCFCMLITFHVLPNDKSDIRDRRCGDSFNLHVHAFASIVMIVSCSTSRPWNTCTHTAHYLRTHL